MLQIVGRNFRQGRSSASRMSTLLIANINGGDPLKRSTVTLQGIHCRKGTSDIRHLYLDAAKLYSIVWSYSSLVQRPNRLIVATEVIDLVQMLGQLSTLIILQLFEYLGPWKFAQNLQYPSRVTYHS